jgi:hypothetical protein
MPAKFQVPKPRPTDYCDPLLINICGPMAIVNSASARLQLMEGDLRHTGQQRHLGEACLHQPLAHGPHRRIGWIGESGRQQRRMTPAERTDSGSRNRMRPAGSLLITMAGRTSVRTPIWRCQAAS